MKVFLKKYCSILILIILSLILFFTNYKPGTFLVGWDNLFPEFNFKLDFYKNFFAIWQQYRGLGLIDGMSHAANLVHDAERLFLSLFLPVNLIRWAFILLLHLIGGLGMIKLLQRLIPRNNISIPLFGALFYQYNLFTIQQFFLPFEVFVVHFAFLPWLIYSALEFLDKGNKKTLIFFFIYSLFSIPQAHVPTLFLVYIIGLSIVFLARLFFDKNLKELKKIMMLVSVIFIVNSFWGLPFAYQTLTNSKNIANSKTFQMSSNDIFYRNNKYGNLISLAILKGFSLDFKHLDFKTNSIHNMMWPWLNHINTVYFLVPAWIFFILALIGLYRSLSNQKLLPFAMVFLFAFFMMGTDIPGVNLVSNLLRQYIPLFSTIFRFTFTKFSIIYVFAYSIMLAAGLNAILEKRKAMINLFILLLVYLLIFSYSFPAFQGHFFYENLAVKIPDEYFQVFDFFQNQNHNERVAILPIPWYWAWLQPKWGTINSGFIWYGIPQPITDLAFTPWGKQNENFYWELDQAVFSKNPQLLEKVLNKYDVSWVYLDKNILNEPGRKMTFESYEVLLNKVDGLSLAGQFGQIEIFHYQLKNNLKNFTQIKNNLLSINQYQYDNYDQAYSDLGDYYSDKEPQVVYPFRSLFSGKSPKDIEYKVEEDDNFLYFKSQIPKDVKNWSITTEKSFTEEFSIVEKDLKIKDYSPEIFLEGNTLIVKIDKNQTQVYSNQTDRDFLNQTNNGCEKDEKGVALLEKEENNVFKLTSIGSNNCIKINLSNLSQRFGYLFNIETVTDKRRGLFFNIANNTTGKSDLETYTDNDGSYHNYYFISPPRGFYDLGYTIYFNNISEGREKIVNTLNKVNIYQIPYYFLKSIKLVDKANAVNNSIYYLSQSYSPGWMAFSNGKILPHVLVNNWANGWKVDDQASKITIVFWPQYLEFVGFGLLAAALIFLLTKKI